MSDSALQGIMANPAPIVSSLSADSLEQLGKVVALKATPEMPYWFPVGLFALLVTLYVIGQLLQNRILAWLIGAQKWRAMKAEHRRTMVIYVLQTLITTIVLIMQCFCLPLLGLAFTERRTELMRACATLIGGLYVFELIWRSTMRPTMIAHHIITLFVMSLAIVLLSKLSDPSFVLTGLLWLFQATTEQTTFVALFMYRLQVSPRILRPMFRVASVQSLVFKMASIAGTIFVWVKWQLHGNGDLYTAYSVIFWIATIGLAVTQIWGSWVVWIMGDTLEKRYTKNSHKSARSTLTSANASQVDLEAQLSETGRSTPTNAATEDGKYTPVLEKRTSSLGRLPTLDLQLAECLDTQARQSKSA
ncbi:hypothetical protein CBOM_06857 [Ceraceosorus bombacis]|uniref:Uncharacterized protein n=1 Tax=Ceraceosorus bombacis TaxID=401625 RepID=A0A0N7LBJ3_9BASI|nr:hypothetical protein CBOM_06857 [Ceraceosorus bombacis]